MVGLRSRAHYRNRRRRLGRRRRPMAVAVLDVGVAGRVGRARKSTCAADAGGMPPSPSFDGRPASSAAMATVTVGPDLAVGNANRRRRRGRRRRPMAVAVVVVAAAGRVGRARRFTCAADTGGMPPSPPFDGPPASSAAMATVTEGPDLSLGSVTQTGGGGVLGLSGGGGEASCGGERARLARARERDKEWSSGKGSDDPQTPSLPLAPRPFYFAAQYRYGSVTCR